MCEQAAATPAAYAVRDSSEPPLLMMSMSRIGKYSMCPRLYWLTYEARLHPQQVPMQLHYGSALHEAAAAYFAAPKCVSLAPPSHGPPCSFTPCRSLSLDERQQQAASAFAARWEAIADAPVPEHDVRRRPGACCTPRQLTPAPPTQRLAMRARGEVALAQWLRRMASEPAQPSGAAVPEAMFVEQPYALALPALRTVLVGAWDMVRVAPLPTERLAALRSPSALGFGEEELQASTSFADWLRTNEPAKPLFGSLQTDDAGVPLWPSEDAGTLVTRGVLVALLCPALTVTAARRRDGAGAGAQV